VVGPGGAELGRTDPALLLENVRGTFVGLHDAALDGTLTADEVAALPGF
jgi:hypothetical protein